MLKLMGKKIFTILLSRSLLSKPVHFGLGHICISFLQLNLILLYMLALVSRTEILKTDLV